MSVVGIGMRSHVGLASKMFKALADEGINIQMISTSEIKIAVVIDEKYLELAVRVLHKAFELEKGAESARFSLTIAGPDGAGHGAPVKSFTSCRTPMFRPPPIRNPNRRCNVCAIGR